MTHTVTPIDPYRQAVIKMIEPIEWQYFFTFTTFYPLSESTAKSLMERYFDKLRPLQSKLFWVAETYADKTGVHLHGLILVEKEHEPIRLKDTRFFEDIWHFIADIHKTGKKHRALVKHYDPTRKAAEYLTKTITESNNTHFEFRSSSEKV
jgi:hypothetical protein